MGEGCGPFREKQACRFSVNILFVCLLRRMILRPLQSFSA